MDKLQFFIYLLILAGSTYLIRAIPFAAVKKKIENRFIRSFLHYIPYTVLAAMTFPAALYATGNVFAASLGVIAAVVFAIMGKSLTTVAIASSFAAFLAEIVLKAVV